MHWVFYHKVIGDWTLVGLVTCLERIKETSHSRNYALSYSGRCEAPCTLRPTFKSHAKDVVDKVWEEDQICDPWFMMPVWYRYQPHAIWSSQGKIRLSIMLTKLTLWTIELFLYNIWTRQCVFYTNSSYCQPIQQHNLGLYPIAYNNLWFNLMLNIWCSTRQFPVEFRMKLGSTQI